MAGGLRQPNITWNNCGAHFVAEVLTDLLHDLDRQLRTGVVHHTQDSADLESWIEILFDFINVAK